MQKHFVQFFSPGTMMSEMTEKPIDAWCAPTAVGMVGDIKERYSATPYGFRFITRSRGEEDLDSKITEISGMYYLGGEIFTREQVEARNDPSESILRSNMRMNGIDRIIVNKNSWMFTGPFNDGDTLLGYKP